MALRSHFFLGLFIKRPKVTVQRKGAFRRTGIMVCLLPPVATVVGAPISKSWLLWHLHRWWDWRCRPPGTRKGIYPTPLTTGR